jgi:lipoprotein NlpD
VRAVKDGTVVYSGNKNKKNGKTIIVKHALGFYSSYMQNQTLQVQSGTILVVICTIRAATNKAPIV